MIRIGMAAAVVLLCLTCNGQQRIESGEWKGFLQEQPPLNDVEIAAPFKVSSVHGIVYYGQQQPLTGAAFELRVRDGEVVSAVTDSKGFFQMPDIPAGNYKFKVTKDGFQSTVGTIIVVQHSLKKKLIQIQLQFGA